MRQRLFQEKVWLSRAVRPPQGRTRTGAGLRGLVSREGRGGRGQRDTARLQCREDAGLMHIRRKEIKPCSGPAAHPLAWRSPPPSPFPILPAGMCPAGQTAPALILWPAAPAPGACPTDPQTQRRARNGTAIHQGRQHTASGNTVTEGRGALWLWVHDGGKR